MTANTKKSRKDFIGLTRTQMSSIMTPNDITKTWNIRTIFAIGKTANIIRKFNIYIKGIGLSEVRWTGLKTIFGDTILYSGAEKNQIRTHNIEFSRRRPNLLVCNNFLNEYTVYQ
jgi:hypothetical protein